MRYDGAGFSVDTDAFAVEVAGQPVDLEPQALDVLLHLLAHRDHLVTKEALLDAVWGDQFVGESALTTRIKQIRRALGDNGRAQRTIKTVHGKGYRFIAPVSEVERASSAPDADTAVRSISGELHNIPAARTALLGRSDLVAGVVDALGASRLVTLVGFGGAGKTSIAQQVGRHLVDNPVGAHVDTATDGVWFVDLVPVQDGAGIDRAVARATGVQLGPDADRSTLVDRIATRRIVVILDNCEHVEDAAADFCGDLLDATDRVRILTTSRVPLRVVGEHRVPVGPLPLVGDDGGAFDLLVAAAARVGAEIPPEDHDAAIELCRRVDGLPLAIELVGTRFATLTVQEVLARLEQIGEAASRERRPDRQSSLATILTDTLATTDPDDVRLLTLLSRFERPFDIREVERMADVGSIDDPTTRLAALLDRSLLVAQNGAVRGYAVLETVRQHAAAHDPTPHATADTYADWCLAAVGTSIREHFYDLDRADWTSARFDDLLAVHRHLTEQHRHDDAAHVLTSTALAMHLDDGSRAEGVLARLDATPPLDGQIERATLHCAGVMAAMAARDHHRMYQHGLDAVVAADESDLPELSALARVMRSWAGVVVEAEQALRDVDDAIAFARSIEDHDTALIATGYKVFHLAMSLRFDEAVEIGRAALDHTVPDTSSYPRRVASTGLMCCLVVDDPAASLRLDDEVRTGMGSAGFWGTAIVRSTALAELGDARSVDDAVAHLQTRLDRSGVSALPDLLIVPAALAHRLGELDRAAHYLRAVRAADEPTQSLMVSTAYRVLRTHVEPGVASTDDGPTADIWREARRWISEIAQATA
ncbi:MAG: winged helix-turn-helix domain-containing protein [Ilumatobacter sp.]